MKTRLVTLAIGALALAVAGSPAEAGSDKDHKKHSDASADNTERNVRDRDDESLTPMDQGNSEADLEITQTIRKAVVAHDDLSVNAQNVKIITKDGVVTLRGPVKSAKEKTAIAKIAKKAAGAKSVDNQLEIESE